MSVHPPAEAAVSKLQEQFPDKSIVILTSQVEMAQLPVVVARLRNRRCGGIALLFTQVPEVVVLHRLWLSRMRDDGVTETDIIPVEEGTFVVGMVKSRVPPERPRPVRRVKRGPNRAVKPAIPEPELEVVEGADLRELDLSGIRRQIVRKNACPGSEASEQARQREVVVKRGIARWTGGQLVPTVAGLLVYGIRPELWLEGARAVVSVDGLDRVFTGNMKQIVREVLSWEPLVQHVGVELIGPALVNSFAHRDWSAGSRGRPVEVVRQGERIEIRNPGALASGWSTRPAPRNPTIHRLLRRRRLAGKPACGLGAVTRGLERLGALPFSLVGRDGMVRFVIEMPWRAEQVARNERPQGADHRSEERAGEPVSPAHGCEQHGMTVLPATLAICPMASRMQSALREPETRDEQPPSEPAPALPAPSTVELAPGSRRSLGVRKAELLELLHQRGEMTTREVVDALDWTRSTTRAVIAAMVEEGAIEGCADAARSPSQRYRVVDGS
jgi:hypothetical protein